MAPLRRRSHSLAPWRCSDCGRPVVPEWATRCRRRTCPGYSGLWAGDQRRKIFANLRAYTEGTGEVLLGAVTAPGAGELPWAALCSGLGEHDHSGLLGCRVDARAARSYNRAAPHQWRRLHRRAYQETERRTGHRPWLLARVWEMQRRGVLHVHPVLACGTPAARIAARVYLRLVAELAPAYGFGFVERRAKPMSSRGAAAYVSAYFVTGRGGKASIEESVQTAGMPRSIVHVSVRLSQATGVTMRSLRLTRYAWGCWDRCSVPEDLAPLVQLGMRQAGVLEHVCEPHAPPAALAA